VDVYNGLLPLSRIDWVDGDIDDINSCPLGQGDPACRCYRCGKLLLLDTLTVDRIKPGCQGGTYRRENIRPACEDCNSRTGGALRGNPKTAR